jgi:hypothetical protein
MSIRKIGSSEENRCPSRKNSGYFDIKITDETNTKAEKAKYIRAAFAAFSVTIAQAAAKVRPQVLVLGAGSTHVMVPPREH